MKKKLLSIGLCILIICNLFGGCASKDSKDEKGVDNQQVKGDSSDNKSEKIVLKWAIWDKEMTPYWKALVKGFESEYDNVSIELIDLGAQDYNTVIATELSGSGSDLDIVAVKDVPSYVSLVQKGVLEPLNKLIEGSSLDLTKFAGIPEQLKINGELYELPFRGDPWLIYYNKDIFDKANIPYPTNDMTFEEYDKLARKLTNKEMGREVYGTHYHPWKGVVCDFALGEGKSFMDGTYDFVKPYYEMVLDEQKDGICMDYATLKTSGLHYSAAFANGNVAMMPIGGWFIAMLITNIENGKYANCKNWGVVKYPHIKGVEPGTAPVSICSISISKTSKNKDMAWTFVEYVCGEKGAEIMASTGSIPAFMTKSASDILADIKGYPTDDASKEALNSSKLYLEMPVNDKLPQVETILNEVHDEIMTNSISIDDGIAKMNKEVAKVLNN